MKTQSDTFTLNSTAIDEVAEKVETFLTNLNIEKKNVLRLRLTVEHLLLNWREAFGDSTPFSLTFGRRFGRPFITMELKGESVDPLTSGGDDFGEYTGRMMANMGLSPAYTYQKGVNVVTIRLKKKRLNPLLLLFLAAIAAVGVGVAGLSMPEAVRVSISDDFLTPLYDTFLGILSTIASPMIFLSVAWGIYGIGDAAAFGRIGKKMLIRFFVMTFLFCTAAFAVLLPFFNLSFSGSGLNLSGLKGIFDLLLGIFPKNIVSPFADGNTMQIILIATVVGCIMLILGSQTRMVAVLIEQINYVIQYLMELVSSMVTAFIFVILLRLIWSGSLGTILAAWVPVAVFLLLTVVFAVVLLAYVSARKRVNPILLFRKIFPPFFISLTTASSSAAFGANVSCCEHDLGIDAKVTNFGIPLGIVLYKPTTAIAFTACVMYFAQRYGVEISLVWLVTAVLVISIITVALPPVPGGTLACYTIVFLQLGLPVETVAVAMVLDVVFDFLSTGFDTIYRQCELVLQADYVGMLNKDILRKK